VSPKAVLDAVAKRKIPSPCRDFEPPVIQPVAQRYTTELSWLLSELERLHGGGGGGGGGSDDDDELQISSTVRSLTNPRSSSLV
jgi:hypothetical protein